jgi:hypothetical protein
MARAIGYGGWLAARSDRGAATSKPQGWGLLGAHGKLKTFDAMILQDRNVEVRDVGVRQKHQSVITCGKPRASFDGAELQGIESLTGQSHNFESNVRVVVRVAELSNSFSECPAEEPHVEHSTSIG